MRHRHLSAAHDARTHADPGRQVLRARRDGRPVRPAPGREVLARAQRAATALARHRRLLGRRAGHGAQIHGDTRPLRDALVNV